MAINPAAQQVQVMAAKGIPQGPLMGLPPQAAAPTTPAATNPAVQTVANAVANNPQVMPPAPQPAPQTAQPVGQPVPAPQPQMLPGNNSPYTNTVPAVPGNDLANAIRYRGRSRYGDRNDPRAALSPHLSSRI